MRLRFCNFTVVACAGLCAIAGQRATAQHSSDTTAPDKASATDAAKADAPADKPASKGILPIPDYAGGFTERQWLLGDLGGARTKLANDGVQFNIDWVSTVESVLDGGHDETTVWGNTMDYNLSFDLMRMGVLDGALVEVRGQSRFGNSVNSEAGSILPVDTNFFLPPTNEPQEEIPLAITTLSYTQYFSDTFAIFLGKFDTLDGDPNAFAAGRGMAQFQNLNFVFSPVVLVTVPYSTLGGGFIVQPIPWITMSAAIMNTSDSSTTSGFSDFGEGWTASGSFQAQYRLGDLPGGFNINGSYAWDNEFRTIGRRFVRNDNNELVPRPDSDDSWSMSISAWQYLWTEAPAEGEKAKPLDLSGLTPNMRGIGVFTRFGWADDDTNPIELAFSVGIGGRGLIPHREQDSFGFGYYYNQVQTTRLSSAADLNSSAQGFEAFYNVALTPATGLTVDLQFVQPPTDDLDEGVVLGFRLLTRF